MILLFGYVKPQKSELLVREFEEYNGIYCSLCRHLGKDYGIPARLALNYDCTFYALLLLSASTKPFPGFHKGRCVVNPVRRCSFCNSGDLDFSAASALTVVLFYYKLLDEIHDSVFWKKGLAFLAYPLALRAYRRAGKRFPEICEIVDDSMKEQAQVERSDNPGIDFCAEPTAHMLSRIFEISAGTDEDRQSPKARVLSRFGYCLGRWIYLMDAADDLSEDLKTKSFNPFAVRFGLNQSSSPEEIARTRTAANQILNQTLSQLGAAYQLMELNSMGSVVRNIVFLGLPQMQKTLLFEKEKTNV